ncbi:MAG: hypothetical protein HUU35_16625, partial [Armatimonadetes bacterium]|nr:hypothetical protein [Armatimonadota bacterium]
MASWRLVHPLLGPEVEPVEHEPHREWAVHNSHAHAHEEVFTLLAGTAHEGLQGNVYPVEPGTFFIFGAYEEHDIFWPPWSPPATQLWLHPLHEHVLVGIEVVDGPRRGGERRVLALPWEKLGLRC